MSGSDFKYPKNEKLKSRKTIDRLFSAGKSVAKFPLRLVYVPADDEERIRIGVSVSKKNFKKASDRNYYKRVLRETYRLNKSILLDGIERPYAMMLLYQTRERLSFAEINTKTVQLFEKFIASEKGQSSAGQG